MEKGKKHNCQVTSQHKTWNDKVRMSMCIDLLVLKPESIKRGGKVIMSSKTPLTKHDLYFTGIINDID